MKTMDKTHSFLRFTVDLLRYKKRITAVNIFCNAVIFSHQAAVTFCIREILNGLEKNKGEALPVAVPFLAGILIVSLIRIAAIMGCAVLDGKRAYYYQNRLRINIINRLLAKKDITVVSGKSGSIFEVLDDDIPVSTFPAELLTEVLGHFIYTLIALTILLIINWKLTLFIFIPLSVAIFGVQRLSEHMKERRKENREAHDIASTFIGDVAGSTLAIRTTGTSKAVLNRYDAVNFKRREAVMRDTVFNERIAVLLNSAVGIGSAIMMFVAAGLMGRESFGIGDFSLFIAHLGTLSNCISRIAELIYESRKAEVSYERILDIIDNEDSKSLSKDANIELKHRFDEARDEISSESFSSFSVKNLCYTYSGEGGFKEMDFTVRSGEFIAVAGGMASGKSTLLGVLMGLMPQQSGDIIWNGEPINDIADRKPYHIAGTPQRGGFFAADIRTNLCLGRDMDDKAVEQSLKIAAIKELCMPHGEGLLKNIGDHGDKLSGGQRQRLSIARTILCGAGVTIIDDCVSALDEKIRNEVLKQLKLYLEKSGHSLIIATNSIPFLKSADTILFMEDGCLTTSGNYQELIMDYPAFGKVVSGI